jgi:hypothetical protein
MAISIYSAECKHVKIDPEKVEKLARRLAKCAAVARALGLTIFGSGHGGLRTTGEPGYIVAYLGAGLEGGAGYTKINENGLTRGKS